MTLRSTSKTHSALYAPRASLCSCVRAYITRSTMNAAPLPESDRLNHFPASPVCSVTWYLHGRAELIRIGDKDVSHPLPCPVVFNGPRTEPFVSCNPGQVKMFMLVLLPEAVHLLTGLDISDHTNCSSAFDQIFDVEWQTMAKAVSDAPDHAARITVIEAFIEPRWKAARANTGLKANWLHDYLQNKALRVATSEWGRSVRQLERRVKAWSGFSLQRLCGFRRDEFRFIVAREMLRSGTSFANVASDVGFADQAHFCRETRKTTGLSPKELTRRIKEEESYWVYRIWS